MSAVFSIIEGVFQAIIAVIEAIATGVEVIIEVIPQVFDGVAQIVGVIPLIVAGIGQVVEGTGQVVSSQFVGYILWFIIETFFIAFFPGYALFITVTFLLFTIYGLLRGAADILGAPTLVAAALAFVALAVNVYLFLAVG